MSRAQWIDNLKGKLILAVIWGHLIQFFLYKDSGFFYDPVFKFIYIFHMPLFAVISGLLASDSIKHNTSVGFAIKRFRVSIIPSLIWALIITLFLLIVNKLFSIEATTTPINKILSLFFDHLWFLWAYLYSSLLILLCSINKSTKYKFYALLIFITGFFHPSSNLLIWTAPFFFVGNFFGLKYSEIMNFFNKPYFRITFLLILAFLMTLIYFYWKFDDYPYNNKSIELLMNPQRYFFIFLSGLVFSTFFILISERKTYSKVTFFGNIGRSSLGIYILQSGFFYFASKLRFIFIKPTLLNYGIVFILALVLCLIFHKLFVKINRFKTLGYLLFGK